MRHKVGFSLTLVVLGVAYLSPFISWSPDSAFDNYWKYGTLLVSIFTLTLLIFLEFNNLDDFFIDQASLVIFIFFCFFRRRLGTEGEIYFISLIALFGFSILVFTIYKRAKTARPTIPLLLFSTLLAGITTILFTLTESIRSLNWYAPYYFSNPIILIIRELVYQLSFVTIIEELLFRGFLVGYLIKFGWREQSAFIVQALLFWLVHYPYLILGNPITFFLSIPILTFSTSYIVKRHKQVFPSILIHTIVNVFVPILLSMLF